MGDKELKKMVKHIFEAYERTSVIANKIDRLFGGRNDLLKPILVELKEGLIVDTMSQYSLECLLNNVRSGDVSVKEASNIWFDSLKG